MTQRQNYTHHSVLSTGQSGEDEGAIFPGQSTAQVDQGAVARVRPLHRGRVTPTHILQFTNTTHRDKRSIKQENKNKIKQNSMYMNE